MWAVVIRYLYPLAGCFQSNSWEKAKGWKEIWWIWGRREWRNQLPLWETDELHHLLLPSKLKPLLLVQTKSHCCQGKDKSEKNSHLIQPLIPSPKDLWRNLNRIKVWVYKLYLPQFLSSQSIKTTVLNILSSF